MLDHSRLLAAIIALCCGLGLASQNVATYTFAQSAGTYTAITGGTQLWDEADNINDETPATVTIPAFPFAGSVYTTMYVSSNGFVTFGSAPTAGNVTPISNTATYSGAVSAFGTDLEDASTGSNTEVRWQTVGNEVVVQWQNLERNNITGNDEVISFQIRLNTLTGAVSCVYAAVSGLENSTTDQPQVGLRGANNTFATNVNNRTVTTVTSGAGSSWANSAAGSTNATTCRFTSGSPARSPVSGQTYTWTPPCSQVTLPNAGTDQAICQTSAAGLSANTPSVGTAAWSVVSGPSTSSGQFSSTTSPTATFTPAGGAGTYTLRWTISNSPCPSRTDDVVITVAGTPTTATVGGTQTICASGTSASLGGNTPGTGTGQWSVVSGGTGTFSNASSGSSTFTHTGGTGPVVLRWTISSSPCVASTAEVSITITPATTVSNAGPDQTICITSVSTTLAANTPTQGTGAWSILAGSPNTSTAQLSSTTSTTPTFTPTVAGTYTLRWTISNSPCAASTNDVVITVVGTPTTANAGGDQEICSTTGTTSLAGNTPAVGTGTWTSISGPSTPGITTANSPTSGVTGLTTAGTYVFQWTIASSPCASNSDQVSIVVSAPPSGSTGSYGPLCTNTSPITLTGTPSGGTWSGAGVSGSTFDPSVTDVGTHVVTYTVVSGPCTVSPTTSILVNQAPTSPTANATSTTVCAGNTVNLTSSASNGVLLSENFNAGTNNWTTTNTSTGGTPADAAWSLRPNSYFYNASSGADPTFNSNDNSQFYLSNSDDQGTGGTTATTLVSPAFSTVGHSSVTLTYYHHYRFNSGASDRARVEVSTNGSSWTTVQTHSSTQGAVNGFVLVTLDLSAYAGEPVLQIRFRYAATFDWWWAVDNVTITGDPTGALSYAWTSNPPGFTSSVQNPTNVTVNATTTYTVTISTAAGCSASTNTSVTAITPPVAGSNNTLTICSVDAPVDLGALLGTHDAGTWSGPSSVVGDMYDPATMAPGNYVYTVAAAPCPDATASITVTENTAVLYYADTDGDGFGSGAGTLACSPPNAGDVTNDTDQCPADPAKQVPGQCGCGNPETDTDSDGTADCNDLCPLDPNKIAPGICGCGVADTDTDSDGTADCNDGCPLDPNKIVPGICGCGVSDADTDSDGTVDCNDGCPLDPNKITPGICGCGVSDADTDGDLTADCNDLCPLDPNKTAPGQCGCGNPDTDTDSDGTADCNDLCPLDPNKVAPGTCGCGVSDVDTDGDLTADCNDLCPLDPNKIAPGICGCGVSDVDTDGDLTADCNDLCPLDPNKIAPGICGCGVSDVDTDGDLTADCNDLCPLDPNKTVPGQCGCGNPETDTDLDGTADCVDGCPTDPDKIAPGICGCETPDTDTDGDGLADCVDPCVDDVNNSDTDSDGTPDCNDNCPLDANKVNPGTCGCGVADTDTDGDTYADCVDGCPADANKIAPGTCGCGVADVDSDNDGALNCNDGCPNDPNKIAPGVCGCGTVDTDTDNDGVADCNDNCPLVQGQIGSTCDDGNANTTNDVLTSTCTCAGTPVANPVGLELTTDNDAASTSWDIIPLAGGPAVCSGGGYANNSTQTLNCDLPDGCYRLRVFDANMDGLCCINGLGGYVLRTAGGQRIIDAAGAGIFSNTAEVALGFCLPIGGDHLTPSRCDRENYLPSDFIQATPNPAVQAQFNVGTQSDDGYQFWIFNPNGGYSRRVLITHASNNYLFPAGADRCSYLRLNSLTSSQIPHNMLVNVRVRSMVNGVYSEFGSACRLKIDLTNQCPTTQLVNDNGNHHSCGLTNVSLNGSRTLYATPVSGATNYQFEFSKPGYLRKIASTGSSLVLTQWYTMPLQYNSTYNVRVRVSFDNGANYCPFSGVCTMSTTATPPGDQNAQSTDAEGMDLAVWPNPNRGEVLTLNIAGFGDESEQEMVISVIDLFGKEVYTERLNVQGDILNTTVDMQGYAAGIYLVNVSTADRTWTERVIVQ